MGEIKPNTNAYAAAHMWVRSHLQPRQECDNCHTAEDRMYHWANISREYRRDPDDWMRLCVPCHKAEDIKALGGRIKARARIVQPTKSCIECGKTYSKSPKESWHQWDIKQFCGRRCSTASTGRKNFGVRQSDETRALKSQLMRERWAKNPNWNRGDKVAS